MTMTKGELDVLHSHLESTSTYLEFGAGASTVYAAGLPWIKHIDSVESSESFIETHLKLFPVIEKAIRAQKLNFLMVDIGDTRKWGFPKHHTKKHLWPNYPLCVFTKKSVHDLVLIDGRFRVSSALSCILNTPDNCKIIIHDFWNRKQYHVLLEFLSVKEQVDTMGVFEKKSKVNTKKIQSLIKKYQYLPNDRTIYYKMKTAVGKKIKYFFPSVKL